MAKTKQDILALIQADHRKVESIFAEIEKNNDADQLYDSFNQLYKELTLHAEAEELVFYPAMREFEETEGLIEEAEEEHAEARVLLEELKLLSPNQAEFKAKISELKEAVMHHVQEEESEIFSAVREAMTDQELQDLSQEFNEAKGRIEEDIEAALSQ